jgi:hypothetical protein
MPIAFDNQSVASVAALRETKMSSSVVNYYRESSISNDFKPRQIAGFEQLQTTEAPQIR